MNPQEFIESCYGSSYVFARKTGESRVIPGVDIGYGRPADILGDIAEVYWYEQGEDGFAIPGELRPAFNPAYGEKPAVWVLKPSGEVMKVPA